MAQGLGTGLLHLAGLYAHVRAQWKRRTELTRSSGAAIMSQLGFHPHIYVLTISVTSDEVQRYPPDGLAREEYAKWISC